MRNTRCCRILWYKDTHPDRSSISECIFADKALTSTSLSRNHAQSHEAKSNGEEQETIIICCQLCWNVIYDSCNVFRNETLKSLFAHTHTYTSNEYRLHICNSVWTLAIGYQYSTTSLFVFTSHTVHAISHSFPQISLIRLLGILTVTASVRVSV